MRALGVGGGVPGCLLGRGRQRRLAASSGTADVLITDNVTGGGNTKDVSDNAASGDINCSFSPDGFRVAFTQGTFGAGKLMTELVSENDNQPPTSPLSDDPGSNDFDGNADWGIDGSPDCPDTNITTTINTPVTFPAACTDTGPAYERTEPREFNDTSPTKGTLNQGPNDQAGEPFTYTPNQNFVGTDSFVVASFDSFGFGTDKGTVTITVKRKATPGGGEVFDGTAGNDTINGTPGPDVINCGAGDDVVNGNGGDDVINCGDGNDRVNGGAGKDQVNGEAGNDQVTGDSGNDRVAGGRGNDRVVGGSGKDRVNGDSGRDRAGGGSGNDRVGGGSGNDRVAGDSGRDRLSGGRGRDRLNGGRGRDRCGGDSGRDRASRCEVRRRIP